MAVDYLCNRLETKIFKTQVGGVRDRVNKICRRSKSVKMDVLLVGAVENVNKLFATISLLAKKVNLRHSFVVKLKPRL